WARDRYRVPGWSRPTSLPVRWPHARCCPPIYQEATLLLIALLRTLWRLSRSGSACLVEPVVGAGARLWIAVGCFGPAPGAQSRPGVAARVSWRRTGGGNLRQSWPCSPPFAVVSIFARDLIIASAPILAWGRRNPDAQFGHAQAHHPRPRRARRPGAYQA